VGANARAGQVFDTPGSPERDRSPMPT